MHKVLIHNNGDHVGIAVADIAAGERVIGVALDDEEAIELAAVEPIPLGHKVAVRACGPGEPVLEYGLRIGKAPVGLEPGQYVHVHNLKSARW